MSDFFKTLVEKLQATAPAIKKTYSKKQKAATFEDFNKDTPEDETPSGKKKFCQYQGNYSHSFDERTTLNSLFNKAKSIKTIKRDFLDLYYTQNEHKHLKET